MSIDLDAIRKRNEEQAVLSAGFSCPPTAFLLAYTQAVLDVHALLAEVERLKSELDDLALEYVGTVDRCHYCHISKDELGLCPGCGHPLEWVERGGPGHYGYDDEVDCAVSECECVNFAIPEEERGAEARACAWV